MPQVSGPRIASFTAVTLFIFSTVGSISQLHLLGLLPVKATYYTKTIYGAHILKWYIFNFAKSMKVILSWKSLQDEPSLIATSWRMSSLRCFFYNVGSCCWTKLVTQIPVATVNTHYTMSIFGCILCLVFENIQQTVNLVNVGNLFALTISIVVVYIHISLLWHIASHLLKVTTQKIYDVSEA